MQAVLTKTQNDMAEIFTLLEEADNNTKNEVENSIVEMGASIVEALVLCLKNLTGLARGIAAMSLIRIGQDAIAPLRHEAMRNKDFAWVADYLISEIECK
ncbi:MAG: hypothetical protein E7Z91_04900 [Cyanobacteria bacterium SIG30]|nr:hypothetical protein [Cyanobacteria bacterium SIG30]